MDPDLPRRLKAVRFRWSARFGFFLRAEAAAAGFGYPVPPRTAVLGVIANLLGLPKDELSVQLADSLVAVSGAVPATHWHNGNYRKTPPAALPYRVKHKVGDDAASGVTAPEKNTQLRQEWLLAPDYTVTAVLPAAHHDVLVARLREGRTHFTPCMGLSEMLADIAYLDEVDLERLPAGDRSVASALRVGEGTEIDASAALAAGLHLLTLAMPRAVTAERRFSHASFMVERRGRPIPCHTDRAYQGADQTLVFL